MTTKNDKAVEEFRNDLKLYAQQNGLELTNIKGWTENKIIWMALNDRKCCCKPNERKCPCKEGLKEAMSEKDHMCLCSVFALSEKSGKKKDIISDIVGLSHTNAMFTDDKSGKIIADACKNIGDCTYYDFKTKEVIIPESNTLIIAGLIENTADISEANKLMVEIQIKSKLAMLIFGSDPLNAETSKYKIEDLAIFKSKLVLPIQDEYILILGEAHEIDKITESVQGN